MLFAETESWWRTAANGNDGRRTNGCQQGENLLVWKADREKNKIKLGGKLISETLCGTKDRFSPPLLQEKFITYLLKGTQRVTPQFALANRDVISHIISCSTGILLLSDTKCDLDVNPNPKVSSLVQQLTCKYWSRYNNDVTGLGFHPQSLFEDIFKIFDTVAWLLGSQSTESFIIKHSMGTLYQSRWGSHKALFYFSFHWKSAESNLVGICSVLYSHTVPSLSNAVFGSQRDGEYIKLPSDSAMASQIKGHRRITSQVCVLHHFTLIHADIHRNVSSS